MPVPKSLIIDANILFSFFKSDSSRRHLIEKLLNNGSKFISPEFVFEEMLSLKDRIMKFCGIDESEFLYAYSLLKKSIMTFSELRYRDFLSKASKLSPHAKDEPYFALALAIDSPIWSDERAFKKQNEVPVFSTSELSKVIG